MNSTKKDIFYAKVRFWLDKISFIDIKKFGVPAGIIIFSTVTFIHLTAAAFQTNAVDFYAFYTGATLLITDKDNLYNPRVQYETQERLFQKDYKYETGFMAFINSPLSAAIYVPFLLIPPRIAEKAAQALTLAVILWTVFRLYRFHKIKFLSWTTFFVASFYPIYGSVHLGQIGTLIFLVVAEMYMAFMEKKTVKLGILSSLLFFKYQYLPLAFLIFAIYEDRKKFIKVAGPCILLLALINYLLMGNGLLTQYVSLMREYVSTPGNFGMEYKFGMDIYSLLAVINEGFKNSPESIMGVGILALFIQTGFFIFLLKKENSYTHGSDIFYFSLILSLVMTPHSMPADFIFLLIPVIGLLPRIKKVWFYAVTAITLSFFFYFSAFGWQWTHAILLLLYLPLLALTAQKNPGFIGQKVHKAIARENPII